MDLDCGLFTAEELVLTALRSLSLFIRPSVSSDLLRLSDLDFGGPFGNVSLSIDLAACELPRRMDLGFDGEIGPFPDPNKLTFSRDLGDDE